MSLYPSLEDMQVDHMIRASSGGGGGPQPNNTTPHHPAIQQQPPNLPYPIVDSPHIPVPHSPGLPSQAGSTSLEDTSEVPRSPSSPYPSLSEFMGMELTDREIALNMPEYVPQMKVMSAPLSAGSVGLARAEVTHGVRQVVVCKNKDGKIGLRVKSINKGVFVALVTRDSPAALAGLRFGDQILQVNGQNMAGFSSDKAHDALKRVKGDSISLAVRDRPFERTITLHKNSTGHIGFVFRDGKITDISVDSSAARNGVLVDHHLLEVNGQNVIGLKDTDISNIIDNGEDIVTITIIPTFIYSHMIKNMSNSLLKKLMDHSIPEC
jgi:syntenin-1